MPVPAAFGEKKNYTLLGGFIIVWVAVNLLQSVFTGLYPDEAYYWVYSRHLQWGYFDHPPMVALLIKLGELIGHHKVFTRLGTVFISAGTVFFLFKALPEVAKDTRIFLISFLSVILFHIYGFVATPDAALVFFTALFFYSYRLFLQQQKMVNAIFLALGISGLLYSKYHGILPVAFTFLSNPKLVFNRKAWLVVFLVTVLFSPHLYWQFLHDWPTFRYHLSERVASRYRISKTTNYLLGQLLVWGPLTAAPAFYHFLKMGKEDLYLRAHQFTFWGVLLFFLISSFNSAIEPHWTLVAGVSFIVLVQHVLLQAGTKFVKIFTRLALVNIALAFIIRLILIVPVAPIANSSNLRPLFYGKAWSDSVYKYVQDTPVVFIDSYVLPSLYLYYHPGVSATGFNTIAYRKNHFSISDDEGKMNGKKVYVEVGSKLDSSDLFIRSAYTNTYLHPVDSFKAVNTLKIGWPVVIKKGRPSEKVKTRVKVNNAGSYAIDARQHLYLTYTFFKTRKERVTSDKVLLPVEKFAEAEIRELEIEMKLPDEPGKYKLVFSVVYPPFEGTLASNFFNIEIE